jgi:hypothetical protein
LFSLPLIIKALLCDGTKTLISGGAKIDWGGAGQPLEMLIVCLRVLLQTITVITIAASPVLVTPISTPGCLYQFGIYPESAQCSNNYIKCAHGIPQPTPCEPGLAYDDKTHSCNWPDLLLDFCSPEGNAAIRLMSFPIYASNGMAKVTGRFS